MSPSGRPSPLAPGYRLDRYELLCPVADGGMASVWVARLSRKHGFEKTVAIKTILPKLAGDDRFQRMFLDEGRIASRIDHVNVAQILDLGEENDVFYIVMEWVDGDSLSRLQRTLAKKGSSIPLPIALRILADTCDGLHAAHELRGPEGALLGVVHRDVSPQNILVTVGGVAKLIDFGIAKAKNRLAADTNAGFLKGKVHYMAPEQALGKPIDRRADVFAVGAILYQLIAGVPPFEGENELETLHKLGSGAPPPPLPRSVPSAVSEVILRALSPSPDDRWSSAAELRAALERAMARSNLSASTSDVAAFMAEHLGDHIAARRRAIDGATQAAVARAAAGEHPRATAASSMEVMPLAGTTPAWPIQATPSGTSPVPLPSSSSQRLEARVDVELGSSGGGSLGLGSVAASVAAPVQRRSRGLLVIVIGLAVLGAIGVVLIGTSLRAKSATARPALAPPASTSPIGTTATEGPAARAPAAESASASPKPAASAERTATPPSSLAVTASPGAPSASPKTTAAATASVPPKAAAVPPPVKPVLPAPTGKRKKVDDGF